MICHKYKIAHNIKVCVGVGWGGGGVAYAIVYLQIRLHKCSAQPVAMKSHIITWMESICVQL